MRTTETHVYFWNGIYSNWYFVRFKDLTGIQFYNTEQAFMWYKAYAFNDIETRNLIENTPDPKAVKKLGRLVKNFDETKWAQIRLHTMIYVNYLKFTQNKDLYKELMETGDKILVEASPLDKIWGVGLDEDNPLILDSKNWQGSNLLGVALMRVRDTLKT